MQSPTDPIARAMLLPTDRERIARLAQLARAYEQMKNLYGRLVAAELERTGASVMAASHTEIAAALERGNLSIQADPSGILAYWTPAPGDPRPTMPVRAPVPA